MEDLGDDSEHDDLIMAGLDHVEIKSEHREPVSIKVLWSHADSDSQLSNFEIPEGIKVKSPTTDDEHSLGNHDDIGENSGDQILDSEGELSVQLKQEPDDEDDNEHAMLPAEHMNGVHILPVSEDGSILTDASEAIHVASSIGSELGENVIQYLLPSAGHQVSDGHEAGLQGVSINLGSVGLTGTHVLGTAIQELQAITLADGNTAFIQPPAGSKFLEGQTITLEDGSTAVVQSIGHQVPSMNLMNTSMSSVDTTSGVSMLDENTTSYINQAVKDNLQAIILEDGTTAYLATQPSSTGGLQDGRHLEPSTLTLDQLTSHSSSVQDVLSNAIINVDPLSGEAQVTTVGPYPGVSGTGGDKMSSTATVVQSIDGEKVGQLILEKGYCCKFEGCGRYYTTLHHLRVHERSHTGDRPFKCEYERCDKAFATGYGLKSHMRVHTGEKPYKCPQQNCDKAFKTSGDLQKHVRTHTGEKPFKCPFVGCDRSFTTSNIRKVHIRTHTGERPYICPEEDCGRAFASATNYKNHVRIHTGEKPYVCTVMGCGKRFTEYSSLYKHHVVHTHSKPYTCERCGKTYRQTSTLAMHKRTTHGENVTADGEELIYQDGSKGFNEEDGIINGEIDDGEPLEPLGKKQRLSFLNVSQEAGVARTLVINSSSQHQQFALVDGLSMLGEGLQATLNSQTLIQHGGLAFTLGDNTQQVFVITDPAQLEALQQIAKHQIDNEAEESALLTNPTSSESSVFESPGVTLVTEIGGSEIDHGKDDFTGSISTIELSSKSPGSLCIDNL